MDTAGFFGQVFLAKDVEHEPKNREVWLCETLRTGDIAEDVHFNGAVVRPIRRLENALEPHLESLTRDHGLLDKGKRICFLGRQARRTIVSEPQLLPVLADVIASMDVSNLPSRGIEALSVNVGQGFAYRSCTGTFPILRETPAIFAYLRGYPFPVRVVEKPLERTSILRFGISFAGQGRWNNAPNKTWGIQWISAGDIVMNVEPTETHNSAQLKHSLDFWKRHARYYREDLMSAPFDSTWQEVLEASQVDRPDERADTEPPEPHSSPSVEDPRIEREGALIPE